MGYVYRVKVLRAEVRPVALPIGIRFKRELRICGWIDLR